MMIDQHSFLDALRSLSTTSNSNTTTETTKDNQPHTLTTTNATTMSEEQTMCELYNNSVHFLSTNATPYGDEHLPYSPYYSPGYSNSLSSFTYSSSSSSSYSPPSSSASVTSEASSSPSFFTASSSSSERHYNTNNNHNSSPLKIPAKSHNNHRLRATRSISQNNNRKHIHHSRESESSTTTIASGSSTASLFDSNKRDYYGFKLPTQWVNAETLYKFDRDYRDVLHHQARKWDHLLAECGGELPPLGSKLKRYARKGIPRNLRGRAWMHYSGAKAKMDSRPNEYKSLLEKAMATGKSNPYAEVIYRDLHRTFPDNSQFSCAVPQSDGSVLMIPESNSRLCALQRVLLAFSIHSPNIGYCQSLNFLAGFFLLFVDNEEEAFWILETTVNDFYPEKMFDDSMDGSTIDQTVLMQLVYEKMPAIWNKLSNKRCFWECVQDLPPITLVTNHWFLTLFINILPVETVARVWDCVFIEGYKVLFRVALAIIKLSEPSICALEDPIDALQLLQNLPKRLIDCHEFMQYVFERDNISSDLTYRDIESRRAMFRNRRLQRIPSTWKQTFSTTPRPPSLSSSSAGLNDTWNSDDVVEQIYL